MKITKIAILILAIAAALYILVPSLSWAGEGTALQSAMHGVPRYADPSGPGQIRAGDRL